MPAVTAPAATARRPSLGIRKRDLLALASTIPDAHFETSRSELDANVLSETISETSGACVFELTSIGNELYSVGFRMPEGLSESDPVYTRSLGCLMVAADATQVPNWSATLRRMDGDFTIDGGGRRYRFLRGQGGRGFIVNPIGLPD